jgi:hypothetical protein
MLARLDRRDVTPAPQVEHFIAHTGRPDRYLVCSGISSRWYRLLRLKTIVSRKTPLDGRLEIPEGLAHRLSSVEVPLAVLLDGEETVVHVDELACTCAKGAGGNHVHRFLSSDVLKSLPAGAKVELTVDVDEGLIRIELEP